MERGKAVPFFTFQCPVATKELYGQDSRNVEASLFTFYVAPPPIMKFYYIYILQSLKDFSLYIGFTENLKTRLLEYNSGKNVSTKYKIPYDLIYFEGYRNKADALSRETFLKSGSGRRYINKQMTHHFSEHPCGQHSQTR